MRGSRRLIGIAVGVGVLVLVLVCGALALLVPRGAPITLLPQAQMQQRAVQWAEDQYAGTPTTLALRASTQGEVNPQRCSPIRWLGQQMSLIAGDREWNHCRDDLPMWEATMQGDFRTFDGNTVHRLQVTFMPDGSVSTWIEGP
jgi:hypothetical protein